MAVAARSTGLLAPQAVAFVHLLAYGLWMGTNVWTTFFAGITMFKNLPRQTFGRLQVRFQGVQIPERMEFMDLGSLRSKEHARGLHLLR